MGCGNNFLILIACRGTTVFWSRLERVLKDSLWWAVGIVDVMVLDKAASADYKLSILPFLCSILPTDADAAGLMWPQLSEWLFLLAESTWCLTCLFLETMIFGPCSLLQWVKWGCRDRLALDLLRRFCLSSSTGSSKDCDWKVLPSCVEYS